MRLKPNQVLSSIGPLRPSKVVHYKTGELLNETQLNDDVGCLVQFVSDWAGDQLAANLNELSDAVSKLEQLPSAPAEVARQVGYQIDPGELPSTVLAKSRVNKLAGYSLITAYRSWAEQPDPGKGSPGVGRVINLGAVDKQLASLQVTKSELILKAKLWENEYVLHFNIPQYARDRDISKWSLPLIRRVGDHWGFHFTTIENTPKVNGQNVAGVDLGIVKPYQAVVLNEKGNRVAEYTSGGRALELSRKTSRVKQQLTELYEKIDRLEPYQSNTDYLHVESRRVKSKLTRLKGVSAQMQATDLIKKLDKHDVMAVCVEDLKWVTAKHGGKWNHAAQQAAITHRANRAGMKTKRVPSANTSQVCHRCESRLVPRSKREMYCSDCEISIDRDLNAAINITLKYVSLDWKRIRGEQARYKSLARGTKTTPPVSHRRFTVPEPALPRTQEHST